jgi:hypothetical protein
MISGIEEDPPVENNEKIKHTSSGCLTRPARLFGYELSGFRNSIILTRIKTRTKGNFYGD